MYGGGDTCGVIGIVVNCVWGGTHGVGTLGLGLAMCGGDTQVCLVGGETLGLGLGLVVWGGHHGGAVRRL